MRKKYMVRFYFRVLVLLGVLVLYFSESSVFQVLEPGNFFKRLSPLHLLWGIWLGDMVGKVFPPRGALALGAAKQCASYYCPSAGQHNQKQLRQGLKTATRNVLPIFAIWTVLGFALSLLKRVEILGAAELFLISVFFYVCDLICVLFWCPFRVFFMHNRCCTTCRIFNWDHIMMTTPLVSIGSLFSWTLVGGSLLILFLWEYRILRYPERFSERTNSALRCINCTDHLCGRKERYTKH